jgi:hypothetical protein
MQVHFPNIYLNVILTPARHLNWPLFKIFTNKNCVYISSFYYASHLFGSYNNNNNNNNTNTTNNNNNEGKVVPVLLFLAEHHAMKAYCGEWKYSPAHF